MKIYTVFKNADMTEGRGPMILDCLYLDEQKAKDYIDNQPGVMGTRRKWSQEKYGDWKIKVMDTKD
jgi:hypothetical protein